MRLTCPSCGAQYEVPDEVIPVNGRDVQCSNCSKTWFQARTGQTDLPEPEEADAPLAEPTVEAVDEAEPAADVPAPVRRELDPKVAEILRQEAERETRLRALDKTGGLESQPDLGLETALPGKSRAATPKAAPAPVPPAPVEEAAVEEAAAAGARRDLLPDVEEINASLRKGEDPSAHVGAWDEDEGGSGGFTRGFAVGLMLIGLLVLAYMNAGVIVASVPPLDPVLTAYVGAVDTARLSFDSMMGALLVTPEI
jgi:predicted Zn finger-like uncharacterized protein